MKTYDLVYNSKSHQGIHMRVWPEPPEGLSRVCIRECVLDRETGNITVTVVGTIEDGVREIDKNIGGVMSKETVPAYKSVIVEKVIAAKGVKKNKIKLKRVDTDTDFRYTHKTK